VRGGERTPHAPGAMARGPPPAPTRPRGPDRQRISDLFRSASATWTSRVAGPRPPCARARAAVTTLR
jgi:hypothetical protein